MLGGIYITITVELTNNQRKVIYLFKYPTLNLTANHEKFEVYF